MLSESGCRYALQLLLLGVIFTFSDGLFPCRLNEARCPSGIQQCIISPKICNGVRDCKDGSDERPALCATYNCSNRDSEINYTPEDGPTTYFQTRKCPSNKMCTKDPVFEYNPEEEDFITFFACNGGPAKCVDGSDEDPKYCRGINCKKQPFGELGENCPSGNYCLWPVDYRGGDNAKDSLCDGRKDCPDGSDEWPSFCKKNGCSFLATDAVRCQNGACIRPEALCNGVKDCTTGDDEAPAFCSKYECPFDARKCADNRTCVPEFRWCDGKKDCTDGSDENPSFCRTYKCVEFAWKCKDGLQCAYKGEGGRFPSDPRCDGVRQCKDGSDEDLTFCRNTNCFKCPNGKECLGSSYDLCDGRKDCSDGSDESPAFCNKFKCPQGRIKCRGKCVNGELCDGRVDCDDESDEKPSLCTNFKCPAGKTKCPGFPLQCVGTDAICNGYVDCVQGGDESPSFCKTFKCPVGNVNCNGKCRPGRFCDGNKDCADGSDENPTFCLNYSCPPDTVECNDRKQCVLANSVCTQFSENACKDGTVFNNAFCAKFNCGTSGNFKCRINFTRCEDPSLLCDGKADCPIPKIDEDPFFCEKYKCPFGYVKCPNNRQCVQQGTLCDGTIDCVGGDDEDPAFCGPYKCLEYQSACADGLQCIDSTGRCNGKIDCRDGSDEKYCLSIRNF